MSADDPVAVLGAAGASTVAIVALDDEQLANHVDHLAGVVQRDSAAARDALAAAADEANRRGLGDLEARAAYLCARAEVNQGRLADALDLIDRARRAWLQVGDELQAWRTDLGRMHVLDDLGRHAEAVAVGEALVAHLEPESMQSDAAQQALWLRAAALENLGVGHGYMGDHLTALESYAAAEQTYRDLGLDEDVPRPMANRGVELIEVGRFAEALEALVTAASGFAASGDDLFVAKCLAYQARAHLSCGDYLSAAAATQQAERHLREQDTTTEYARTQLVRAETLASLNLLEEALALYDELSPRFAAADLRHDLADATFGRGTVLARMRRRRDAEAAFGEAVDLFEQVQLPAMVATALLARSELIDPIAAAPLVDRALESLRGSSRSPQLAAALLRKAELAETPAEAERFLAEIDLVLAKVDIPSLRWRTAYERGRWRWATGNVVATRQAFESALAVIDEIRSTIADENHRMFFMAGRDAVLEDLIALELQTGDLAAAYRLAERARARTLVERMAGESEPEPGHLSSAALDAIYDQLLRAGSTQAPLLRSDARKEERRWSAPVTLTTPVATPELEAAQHAGVVVTYQTVGDEIVAFVQRGDDLHVATGLATVAEVRQLVAELDAQWRRFEDPGLAARQHAHLMAVSVDILQRMYLRLVSPLPALQDAPELLVVPCDPVGNVPFAALHDGVGHLVEQTSIVMAPSRAVAAHAARRRRNSYRRRLAVGVTDLDAPHVATEVREVAAAAESATILLDADASVAALRHAAPVHDVVHLACHGVHRPDSPLFSALRLADRWLTAAEVPSIPLDGQLVVLSACSSGRQRSVGTGDELVGLPRAFLAAGAGGVIVNLWHVDDASSRALMTRLHRHLATSDPPAALRRAQIDLMSELPHPYHWAPAVVFGAPRAKEHP